MLSAKLPLGVFCQGGCMTTVDQEREASAAVAPGRLGRLGTWATGRLGLVAVVWLAVAGWQAKGSQSVQVRELARRDFGGNASSALQVVITGRTVTDPRVQKLI